MSDLAEFLRARYAERRTIAEQAAQRAGSADWRYEPGADWVSAVETNPEAPPARRENWEPLVTEACSYVGNTLDDEIGNHIASVDPEGVLADLDIKLAIVDLHAGPHECSSYDEISRETNSCQWVPGGDCTTLRLLAKPFAGHHDYKAEDWEA
ncbi:DUF6221 family protein [Streptomyces lydicamycinicus]|uniref:DUF6221 family protein n=1 Tax=Streptomyces lydicamycinicus TaxID=1546107 RepID=UPI003C2B6622